MGTVFCNRKSHFKRKKKVSNSVSAFQLLFQHSVSNPASSYSPQTLTHIESIMSHVRRKPSVSSLILVIKFLSVWIHMKNSILKWTLYDKQWRWFKKCKLLTKKRVRCKNVKGANLKIQWYPILLALRNICFIKAK